MKVLLVAINSKFVHSNLAVRYLKAYTKDLNYQCEIMESTINDRIESILEDIIIQKPDLIAFSCYIWNIEYVKILAKLIKLINSGIEILYGGPEVSYDSKEFLKINVGEYIIIGEGEETYREFIQSKLINEKTKKDNIIAILGLYIKKGSNIYYKGRRELMDMNNIIFPYDKEEDLSNKIVYYEGSRGCPFNCKYCLSSTEHGVRFMEIDRVQRELQFLMNKGVTLVKFVDRTFNCNSKFAMGIWEFLIKAKTNTTFHFEISADILKEEELLLLAKAAKGRFQFEVGVQTTNDMILENINRHVNFNDINEKVLELEKLKNINQHLDLIAGLPGETLESLINSFNDVYSIAPNVIQLGFLKLLKGSSMREEVDKWGIVFSPYPPYEVLKTNSVTYEELILLKRVEKVLDKYYNSGKFSTILKLLISKFKSPFEFYNKLGLFFYESGYFNRSLSFSDYYRVFLEFNQQIFGEGNEELMEIIKYDYIRFNKKKWLPEFLHRKTNRNLENIAKAEIKQGNLIVKSINYHIEGFNINIFAFIKENIIKNTNMYILFEETSGDVGSDVTYLYN